MENLQIYVIHPNVIVIAQSQRWNKMTDKITLEGFEGYFEVYDIHKKEAWASVRFFFIEADNSNSAVKGTVTWR